MAEHDTAEALVASTTTALIVLDAENRFFFTERGGDELAAAAILPNLERVVAAARAADVLRIMVTVSPDPKAQTEPWERRRRYLSADVAKRLDNSPWGRSIVDPIQPRDGEIEVKKLRTSAFFGTPLESYLRKHGVQTVILAGVASNGAVIATTTDAVSRDFYCFVLGDATVGTRPELHEAALSVIGYENVISTAALCELWQAGATTTDDADGNDSAT